MVNHIFPENNRPKKERESYQVSLKEFDERIAAIKNQTEKFRAHELMDLVESAAMMASGKDKRRNAHWNELLQERADDLKEHLRVWG